ncbi:glycosyltransferase [Roseateles toxinivorans]|uniref:Glycosyltransferase involved in cell wall biosynthesis n=1 Tax=Roseateles toxinivorans TaxID=270368 RepID=A0A4R6QI55_9BURK|nr:glycosyltransferase [Roseateles toxinivorans]TDP63024.1 glycosyltransferase involved in cell wall biosynthesis [Roseateles toxinivorans]
MPASTPPVRVLHFVTGGFSGATQVAVDLASASLSGRRVEPLLVLRRKRNTDAARVQALQDQGLAVRVVPGWSHLATIWALVKICREFKPEVLVAHGFPEHLLGRHAGLWAGVKALVQVEHNTRERYTRWRLAQARWLSARTAWLVGVSEGVRRRLVELGFPEAKTLAIPNGIRMEPFADAELHAFDARVPGIVMSARFARQKDHLTLIRAIALLKAQGLTPPVLLAGGGKASLRAQAEAEVAKLGLQGQVRFLGHYKGVPELLMTQQICVLSTHWEGMPLSLVEGMAAGCAVVGSAVPGVQELIIDQVTGFLVPEGDAKALAEVLAELLRDPGLASRVAQAARRRALEEHGLALMTQRYEDLLVGLATQA